MTEKILKTENQAHEGLIAVQAEHERKIIDFKAKFEAEKTEYARRLIE
jgi:hypothetical protein